MTLAGLGSAFWGLVIGLFVHALQALALRRSESDPA
jgi:predicted benzoate:H+ symporter BenE